jgi:hypothetical protein
LLGATFFVVEGLAERLSSLQRSHEWTQKTLFMKEETTEGEEKTLLV